MKVTLVGDPHAKPDNLDRISQLFDLIERLGNPTVLLGDLLDTKELIRSRCFNLIWERIKNSKLHFYVLVGNHDWHNLDCRDHSLQPLKELPNVTLVDQPHSEKLGSRKALFLPYYHDLDAFRKDLRRLSKDVGLFFLHQGVTGFDYGNGFIAENEVDPSELPSKGTVVSGHFHKYQRSGNFMYLGTPFSHSFGESNQEKYLGILDTETGEVELIEAPFKSHVTVELDCDQDEFDYEALTQASEDAFLRVILTGSQARINEFDKDKLRGRDIKILERPDKEDQTEIVVSEQDSNEVKFLKWGREIKKLDEDTLALGISILRGEVG